jgi:hypothetical protein
MRRVLRGCQATVAALVLGGLSPANAATNYIWQFSQDDESAFLGMVDANAKEGDEDYPFYMSCAATGDETTVISNLDAKALGESIAKGDVPSVSYLLDGQQQDDTGGQVADIRFDEMSGTWQYIIAGADYDLLLTAKAVKVKGVGIDLDLPQKDMAQSLQKLKDACDALLSSDDGSDSENGGDTGTGSGGASGGSSGSNGK